MSAQNSWVKAEEYLEMGYTAAAAYEKRRGEAFNRKQLDDRKAKFLAERANSTMRAGPEFFRDLKEALDIVRRLMSDSQITHHPYETLLSIVKSFYARGSVMSDGQRRILIESLKVIVDHAKKKVALVSEGYQRTHARECLNQIDTIEIL